MKWGIIGCGHIALKRFSPALSLVPGARLVAVQNRSMEKAARLAQQLGVARYYDNAEELLADPEVEVVYIASPTVSHLPETLAAARAGKHVLCEKPMAMNTAEARVMLEACDEAGVKLMLANMMRFHACHREARRLFREGAIGRLVAARVDFCFLLDTRRSQWRLEKAIGGGGPVMDVGIHAIDLLRYVTGSEVASVQAMTQGWAVNTTVGGDAEDTAVANLLFRDGCLANITVSFSTPDSLNRLELYGSEGMLWTEGTIGQESTGKLFVRRNGTVEEYSPVPADIYAAEIAHLEECIREGRQPLIDGTEGMHDLAVAGAIYQSARTGCTVTIQES
ncbi:MAG: Gfo/Idh/MocA family oxidoreductase [Clostridia bacterium]|nr:Gfo/Idh/MocA family oxidoreductase [Clostridia bacterium]